MSRPPAGPCKGALAASLASSAANEMERWALCLPIRARWLVDWGTGDTKSKYRPENLEHAEPAPYALLLALPFWGKAKADNNADVSAVVTLLRAKSHVECMAALLCCAWRLQTAGDKAADTMCRTLSKGSVGGAWR